MVSSIFENNLLSLLILCVLGSVVLLHFLLFREYILQDRIQSKRLQKMEGLMQSEIQRSQSLNNQVGKLAQIKEKTQEKLDLIKLQIKLIDVVSKKNKL